MHKTARRFPLAFVLAAGCMDAKPSVSTDSSTSQLTTTTQAPAPATAAHQPSPVSTLTFDTTRWTADAEAKAIAASRGRVTRKGPLLEIRVAGQRSVTLDDQQPDTVREPDDEYVEQNRYVYLGELATLGYDVIGVAPAEFSQVRMLLLNQQTGGRTEISGVPVPSPDRKRFLVTQHAINREMNSVEIWSLGSGAPQVEWGTGDDYLQPIDGEWKDDSTLIYRVVPMQPGAKVDTTRMLLQFRNGEWKDTTPVIP